MHAKIGDYVVIKIQDDVRDEVGYDTIIQGVVTAVSILHIEVETDEYEDDDIPLTWSVLKQHIEDLSIIS